MARSTVIASRARLALGGAPVALSDLRRVYRNEVDVALDEAAVPALTRSQALVQAIADADEAIYGINTGFGKLAQTKIAHDRLAELQRNLVLSHSAGIGAPLSPGVVRLVLVTKALGLARGYSGVRVDVVRALLALANAGVLPRIPGKGSVGASGDLAPLAHLARVLIGEGEVFASGAPLPLTYVIVFEVKKKGGQYATSLNGVMPPIASEYGFISAFNLLLRRQYASHGERLSYASAGCPAPDGFTQVNFPFAKASFQFADGRVLSSKLVRKCTVRR